MARVEQSRHQRPAWPFYLLTVLALLLAQGQAGSALAQQWETNGNNINNTNTGNVGVGTNAPVAKLHVEAASTGDNHFTQGYFKNTNPAFPYGGVAVDGQNQSHVRFLLGGALKWQWRVGAGAGLDDLRAYNWALNADVLTLTNTGNVGIGTSSPSASRLHIQSPSHTYLRIGAPLASQSALAFNDDTNGQDIVLYRPENTRDFVIWTATASNVMRVTQAGNVGVGTNAPAYKFDVQGGRVNASGGLCIAGDCKTSWSQLEVPSQWTTSGSNIHYSNGSGNVGIGTTAPAEKLHVVGNIHVTGNINAKYQDVAEWVPSTQKLAAGTVVILDTTRSNHVVASSDAYDTRVAGVISAQPGVLLGEGGEGRLMVATTGRVRVKVDATRGPIRVGDLLVTSDVKGLAMKSEPVPVGGRQMHLPGTLIGKALEPLEKGVGEILVLLSLQ